MSAGGLLERALFNFVSWRRTLESACRLQTRAFLPRIILKLRDQVRGLGWRLELGWGMGPLVLAKFDMFNGAVTRPTHDLDGICEGEYDQIVISDEVSAMNAPAVSQVPIDDPDCEGWDASPIPPVGGGGGGGEGGGVTCYAVTFYWIHEDGYAEEIGTDYYCFPAAS